MHDIPSPEHSSGQSSAPPSAAGSSSNDSMPRGILRGGVSFNDLDTRSAGVGSQGSGSSPASIEGVRSEHSGALRRTKDINARILDAQRQNDKLESQIEHYVKIANLPRIGFSDKDRAMDKVKQLRLQQAARSRCAPPRQRFASNSSLCSGAPIPLTGETWQDHRRTEGDKGQGRGGRRTGQIDHSAKFRFQIHAVCIIQALNPRMHVTSPAKRKS
jgi:hypothetical protein